MDDRNHLDGTGAEVEEISAERTVAYLREELDALDPATPAAQLYVAFVAALTKLYPTPSAQPEAYRPRS